MMKNLSFDEFRTLVKDVKTSEDKKNLFLIVGVFVAVFVLTAGLVFFIVKKHGENCADDFYDDWDDEEDYFDDDFEEEDSENEEN